MINQFDELTPEQQTQMLRAIPLITILIAEADGRMDEKEIDWAKKMVNIRSFSTHDALQPFYEHVEAVFDSEFSDIMSNLPADRVARQEAISAELSQLNDLLPELNATYSHLFYKSLLSFAEHIAKAAGGFLGSFSIGPEEKKWIGLPMVHPH